MKKAFFLFVCIVFVAGSSCFAQAGSRLSFERLEGNVNSQEIGDAEYAVVSIWDERGHVPLNPDGSFTTVIGSQRPQKITLVDAHNKIRALSVVVPGYTQKVVFDAHSTASAVLLADSDVFGQSPQVIVLLSRMEKSKAFQDFVIYLRKNLARMPLQDLAKDDEYVKLVESCQEEIFGADQKEIMNSLQSAEKELEKVMK